MSRDNDRTSESDMVDTARIVEALDRIDRKLTIVVAVLVAPFLFGLAAFFIAFPR